jgi:hypothetical protein
MAETVIGAKLSLDSGQAEKSLKNFKQELREASNELVQMASKFGGTSTEAINAAKKVAQLKDAIGDAKQLSDGFNPDRKFAAFSTAIQGVVGGFSALQGAIGLFGVKSKEVEETLLKVQSAMALSQGLSSLLAAGEGFKNLRIVAVAALQRIRDAIGATGIGLLVIALGAIVTYWEDIKEAVFGVSEEQKKLLETTTKTAEAEEKKLSSISEQDNILKLQGKTEEQILRIKIAQTDEVIKSREQQALAQQEITKAQIATAERNKQILVGILNFLTAPIKFLIKEVGGILNTFGAGINIDALLKNTDATNNRIADYFFSPEGTKKAGDEDLKIIQDTIAKTKNERAGYLLSIKKLNEEAAKDRKAQLKEEEDAERKHIEELVRMRKEAADIEKKMREDAEAQRKAIAEKKRIADEATMQADLARETAQLERENQRRIDQVILQEELDIAQQTSFQKQLDDLNKWYADKLAIVTGNEELQAQLTGEYERIKSDITRNENLTRLGIIADILGQAANLLGKQTAAGKALAIAEATINTYAGATAALRSKVPFPEPVATAIRIAQAGLIIATGLKSIREIAKTNVPGGSGGGAPAIPSLSVSAPAPLSPTQQSTLINDESNGRGNAAAGPIRVYTVEADGANQRERSERLSRAARLGG